MVVDRVLRLDGDCPVVTLNGPLVVLHFVVSGAQVAVVCSNLRIDLDGLGCQLDFLFEVALLAHRLSLQVQKIAGIALIG